MLRIVKATEPITVERINLCLYAPPGVGKTTTFFTSADPLLLDFDGGVHRASNRKDCVRISSWADVESISKEDLSAYRTLGVDTAGRALDFLSQAIMKANPKLSRGGGALTLQGFGELKSRFSTWLKLVNSFGLDVVLIAHMDEQRAGDDIIERLDVQGGSKGEIYKSVDAMGRIFVRETQAKHLQRVLDFSPRENSFGKNPANLEPIMVPDPATNPQFLAEVIANIKSSINRLSEEQKAAQAATEEWCSAIRDFSTADDFNRTLVSIKNAPKAVQLFFAQRAKELKLVSNKESHCYEAAS